MTDSNDKEFETLDELYRRTFENLPAQPAASGWDTPSERVWQHVRDNITPPRGGWTATKFGLLAAFAVSLAVGLYFLLARPEPAPATSLPYDAPTAELQTMETTEISTLPEPTIAAPAQPANPRPAIRTTPETTATPRPVPYSPPHSVSATAGRPAPPTAAQPLPGTQPSIPNTTERRRLEALWGKNAAWRAPLPMLPPAGMKNAPPPDPKVLRF